MFSIKFLLFLCLIPAIIDAGIPGGPTEIDVKDEHVQELVKKALNQIGGGKTLVEVVNATRQVVSGTLTSITLKLSLDGVEETCKVKIWEQPWNNNFTQITVENCSSGESAKKSKRSIKFDENDLLGEFEKFMKKHKKVYSDEKEYKKRYHIFRANIKKIQYLQENEQGTAKYGINQFADLSPKEFKQYLGLKKPSQVKELPQAEIPNISLPDEFDWRHYNVVTPVKNQEACGSCWAFSVTGNIEGQWALRKGELLSLSEQELVDCDKADDGCSGGYMTTAYDSIVKIGGLETEQDYPYEGENEDCHFNKSEVRVKIAGGLNITSNETQMAQWLVKNGPISVALNAAAMQFYMGGVSHPFKFLCNPQDLDHGVLIVGFGVRHSAILKKTLPYWIIKNSWGRGWGELGYYRLYRGDGTCGINQMVSSAIVA